MHIIAKPRYDLLRMCAHKFTDDTGHRPRWLFVGQDRYEACWIKIGKWFRRSRNSQADFQLSLPHHQPPSTPQKDEVDHPCPTFLCEPLQARRALGARKGPFGPKPIWKQFFSCCKRAPQAEIKCKTKQNSLVVALVTSGELKAPRFTGRCHRHVYDGPGFLNTLFFELRRRPLQTSRQDKKKHRLACMRPKEVWFAEFIAKVDTSHSFFGARAKLKV